MGPSKTIRLEHVHKYFGSQRALDDVCLEIRPGSLHALLGGNGAGKSTLGWLLAGRFPDYGGEISIGEHRVKLTSRREAISQGIQLVTQEPALAPNLSLAANLFLGAEPTGRGRALILADTALAKSAQHSLEEFGLSLNPSQLVQLLPLEQRQVIDILRAYTRVPHFLIVDEPPSLGSESFASLFHQVLQKLKANGTGILLITHQVAKALAIADTVTVIRDGVTIETRPASDYEEARALELMFPSLYSRRGQAPGEKLPPVVSTTLQVQLTSKDGRLSTDLCFDDGCVLGIKTKPSMAASKVLRSMSGVERFFRVKLRLNDRQFTPRTPREAVNRGIAYLSPDRELESGFPNLTVRDNLTFRLLDRLASLGIIKRKLQSEVSKRLAVQVDIDETRLDDFMRNLSGGNQQRALLGRIAGTDPTVCLLDEPNRGLDVASIPNAENQIRGLAKPGRWIVIASSDDAFLQAVCHRVLEFNVEGWSDALGSAD